MKASLFLSILLGACSSIVSDPCANGFHFVNGACVASSATQPDGGIQPVTPPDGPVCMADTTSDPFNCGACGFVCPSGICSDSKCVGSVAGHIVGIGHDFQRYDQAMARVLGNAVALGRERDVAVAIWVGSAAQGAINSSKQALTSAFAHTDRSWHEVPLPEVPSLDGVDVLLVDAQRGNGDGAATSATPWRATIDNFLQNGGVVVVLEGKNGVSWRWAAAAGVFDAQPPVDATSTIATVIAPTDATTQNVISPYMAEETSVAYPGASGATIATDAGAIAFHLTR